MSDIDFEQQHAALLTKQDVIQKQIDVINEQMAPLQKQMSEVKRSIIDLRHLAIRDSWSKFPAGSQQCTCEKALPGLIPCRRHLSKYYKNQGCEWCNYTDCSEFNC